MAQMQANAAAILCLGCAQDIAARKDDRRALQNESAKAVVDSWRSILANLDWDSEEKELCAESMAMMNVDNHKMCRNCFSGFERYYKLVSILKDNLAKSVESQLCREAQPKVKRPRIATIAASNFSQPPHDDKDGESSSPSVSVSIVMPLLLI